MDNIMKFYLTVTKSQDINRYKNTKDTKNKKSKNRNKNFKYFVL